MSTQKIIEHYEREDLYGDILLELDRAGVAKDQITMSDLSKYDEMHIGRHEATQRFASKLDFAKGQKIIDIGAGLGGPARYIANKFQCHVTGIDLTPQHVETANKLSQLVSIAALSHFQIENACDLSFEDESFDGGYTIHTGMNIKDKGALYREIARILKPGSIFGIYEVFLTQPDSKVIYPLPWSSSSDTSHLITIEALKTYMSDNNFEIVQEEDHKSSALNALAALTSKIDPDKKPEFSKKIANLTELILKDRCKPYEIIYRKL